MAKFTKLNIGDAVASSGGRVFKKLSTVSIPTEQLPPPYGVTIDGNTLTWGDYSALATNFDILVDGVVSANTAEQSFPLSYFGFSDGTYSISVVSKADGYLDSDPSEAVSYIVLADELAGTWVFNDYINLFNITPSPTIFNFRFSIGQTEFSRIRLYDWVSNVNYGYMDYYDRTNNVNISDVYKLIGTNNYKWKDNAYKTINITSMLSDVSNGQALLAWLKANATKQ